MSFDKINSDRSKFNFDSLFDTSSISDSETKKGASTKESTGLSDKEIKKKFAPIGHKLDAVTAKAARYITSQSAITLSSAVYRALDYVNGDSKSTAADFFKTRASFAEVALMSLVSTIYNFLLAVGSTVLAGITFGQVQGLNEMFKRNWLHTGLAAGATVLGAAGFVAPTLAVGGYKFAFKKTAESFRNQIVDIIGDYKRAGLDTSKLASALYGHLKTTVFDDLSKRLAHLGVSVAGDLVPFVQDTVAKMIGDEFAAKKKVIRDEQAKEKADFTKDVLDHFGIKKLGDLKPEQTKIYNGEMKKIDENYKDRYANLETERKNALEANNNLYGSLGKVIQDSKYASDVEAIVGNTIDKGVYNLIGDKKNVEESENKASEAYNNIYLQAGTLVNTIKAKKDLSNIQGDKKLKKEEKEALVKDAKENVENARKEEKVVALLKQKAIIEKAMNAIDEDITKYQDQISSLNEKIIKAEEKAKDENAAKAATKDFKAQIKAIEKSIKGLEERKEKLNEQIIGKSDEKTGKELIKGIDQRIADLKVERDEREIVQGNRNVLYGDIKTVKEGVGFNLLTYGPTFKSFSGDKFACGSNALIYRVRETRDGDKYELYRDDEGDVVKASYYDFKRAFPFGFYPYELPTVSGTGGKGGIDEINEDDEAIDEAVIQYGKTIYKFQDKKGKVTGHYVIGNDRNCYQVEVTKGNQIKEDSEYTLIKNKKATEKQYQVELKKGNFTEIDEDENGKGSDKEDDFNMFSKPPKTGNDSDDDN